MKMAYHISESRHRLIANTFLFQGIDDIIVEHIITDPRCTQAQFPKGAVIFDETHFTASLGILLSGQIRVDKRTPGGQYMKMSLLKPGECFGAAAMFMEEQTYATRLTAERNVQVLFIPEEIIRWAMRRDFTMTENYIRYLLSRIRFLNEKISSLTVGTVEQRLAVFLLENCDAEDHYYGAMSALSRQLNMGRASLYRAIESLEQKDLVKREGKCLKVLSRNGLEQQIRPE